MGETGKGGRKAERPQMGAGGPVSEEEVAGASREGGASAGQSGEASIRVVPSPRRGPE